MQLTKFQLTCKFISAPQTYKLKNKRLNGAANYFHRYCGSKQIGTAKHITQTRMYCTSSSFYEPMNVDEIKETLIKGKKYTPALKDYLSFKEKYPDFLLLFQLGDFFEMFFEDAVRASEILDITLTKRNETIPMCGIPCHSLDNYLERLIKRGVMVAVCEQIETREHKKLQNRKDGLIKREVTRLVTPGTLTEDTLLPVRQHNYLLSVSPVHEEGGIKRIGLAWAELSTGEFQLSHSTLELLPTDIARLSPSEIILPSSMNELIKDSIQTLFQDIHTTTQPTDNFNGDSGEKMILNMFPKLDCKFSKGEFSAANALMMYIHFTQKGKLPQISPPGKFIAEMTMSIDPTTRRSLELNTTQQNDTKGSVLSSIDRTITGSGARLLFSRLNAPILSINEINHRLDMVEYFYENPSLINDIRDLLKICFDIERCLQRISLDRGGPRDLSSIVSTLSSAKRIRESILKYNSRYLTTIDKSKKFSGPGNFPSHLLSIIDKLGQEFDSSIKQVEKALIEDPPFGISEGGFIKPSYSPQLDEQRLLRDDGKKVLEELTEKYRIKYSVPFRLKYTMKSIGYHLEVNPTYATKVDNKIFFHCQTKKSGMCYKTQDMMDLEFKIQNAANMAISMEEQIFHELSRLVLEKSPIIKEIAHVLSQLDVSTGLALHALENNYVRPVLLSTPSQLFNIQLGRHVTIELKNRNQMSFTANDCYMNENRHVMLITGANMGGKSTFLRQNALIAILGQMGSFVPAKLAEFSIIDAVFSRVGASDDLLHNRSTFMVEMIETASIILNATSKSLVIMDEIGRGTATVDGLSIAQAVIEHLHNVNQSRTLFATHYHELTHLESTLNKLNCFYLAVDHLSEDGHETPLFLHKVVQGIAKQSYGIQVAKLAGIVPSVSIKISFTIKFNFLRNNKKE
eukprot:TRINITY_DN6515_c0_g1_i2.p1 TRINITY_DN6515_c0_g1~~TRINITY_DN6515_c0_g1_i2.p1  ORF type:complete len:912 (-),score=133.29 TRINITY_DN6515_c0_g1_i2:287-3022(-)